MIRKTILLVAISSLTLVVALLNFWVSLESFVVVKTDFKQVERRRNSTSTRNDPVIIFPDATVHPYNHFTPHLNVIWSRGWYNAVRLPAGVPMQYYNEKGRSDAATNTKLLATYFSANDICSTAEYVWVRGRDLSWFVSQILPALQCTIHLITSDAPHDVPYGIPGGDAVIKSDKIVHWYAQDKASDIEKIIPIPLGIPIHYGFPGSPHSLDTVERMIEIRNQAPAFEDRSRMIFYDKGTVSGGSGRRSSERSQAYKQLSKCNNIQTSATTKGQHQHQIDFWTTLASHQFGVCVTGVGWDTFRIWEMLFFGVIPIVKSSPLDLLLVPAHVPVLIVQEWSDICDLSDAQYNTIVAKYNGWIQNSLYWLQPSLWIPRNQELMNQLCEEAPGCEL